MKKSINILMLAGILLTTTLAGCNSGANGSLNNSTPNTTTQLSQNKSMSGLAVSASTLGSINLPNAINMVGADIVNTIIDPDSGMALIGTQLLSLITGSVFPSKPTQTQLQQLEAQNAQMFSQIQSSLQNINAELNTQGTLLLNIQESIDQNQQINTQLAISQAQSQLQTILDNLNSYISLAIPGQANQVNALLNNAESGTVPESAVAILMKDTGTLVSRVPGINGNLDQIEMTLAGDNATQYSINNPSLHNNPESYGTASNTQLIASLQAAYNLYVLQSNGSTNLFQNQLAWNNTIDSTILQLMQNLNVAYRIDQLRLYLSMNLKTKISPPTSIYYGDLNDYATASADLAYAYQQRYSFLMYLDNLYKTNFWNNFMGVLGSGLSQSCNLSLSYLSSLSNASNMGSWNGTNLTISCNGGTFQSQGQNVQPVLNTNFTPSLPCNTNSNGIYADLTVTKAGYIICGTNSNDWNNETDPYGNQIANKNINNTIAAANNGVYAPNIAPSQYSWAYLYVPFHPYDLGTMQVTLPDYNNGSTILTEMGGTGSGIWGITAPDTFGTVTQNVQTVPQGEEDFDGPLNVINAYDNGPFILSLPVIYYDGYHTLMMQATCATSPTSPAGCGIALACIPGLSDCTNAPGGSTATLNDMNLSAIRTNDSIQFANGDNLQLSLTNIGNPNNAGLATIQYNN